MPRLVLLQGGEAIPYGLDGDVTVLGRAPECQIQLDSNMVSRRHAQVVR
ncbi:MAG TPA: FHA domain-containing protein, partial [Planctomycetaceae bacterium]|nr:FHA domain-containing protein [Planctomycetaceae bacterium]